MYKRFWSLLLCLALLGAMILPVYAEETEEVQEEPAAVELKISTAEEFLAFGENCRLDTYSQNLVVYLEANLDLDGIGFTSIPLFSGVFYGGGHTISGLTLTAEGSQQGLFRYLTDTALVQDLQVQGTVQPGGSRDAVGGIAGSNAGSILNCGFSGTVTGSDDVGGLVGINTVTGIIDGCAVSGEVYGDHFVGGIAGENYGVIRNCENKAQINTTAQQNSVEIGDITMDTLTASESADTTTDIGGIAGLSSGVVRDCVNRGNVGYQQMGYNIGGIAGTQSGYITGCKNYAQIQGRKEVGGIVGQMEPAAVIEYTEDTLQILQGQLNTMSGLVGQASSNAQSNASQITGQIGVLQDQAKTARDAVDTLFPSGESSQLPDVDTILAAQNTLTTTINAMPGTLNSIAAATQNTVSGLTSDLQAVSGQISAMGQTINGASENLGGSITDISDQDTPENYTGKVESCANYGSVLADLNVGGIAGAMAMEKDLDIQEDWEENGDTSLNFSSEVRAVILRCENSGLVTGNKQHAGGIVGWQALGLVKSCVNTGQLDGENADYVGGISGTSGGFIRGCSAKGYIHGSTYVGGIAGSASIVTDCRSMVVIADGSERLGAILGGQEEAGADEETPISGNFYVSVAQDMGAIDGISYTSLAEPLDLETFLALESLPEIFRSVTVCFQQEDGTEKRISLASGGSLDPANVPPVPEKEGYVGQWQGLEDAELSNIVFDMTFPASYTAYHTTIQSEAVQGDGLPVLLVQGAFTGDSQVAVSPAALTPAVAEKETLVEAWDVALSGTVQVTGGRLRIPEDADMGHGKLLVRDENGAWREVEYTTDDSYLVFPMDSGDTGVAVVKTAAFPWQAAAIAAGAALLALGALGIFLRIRKGRKKPRSEQPQA